MNITFDKNPEQIALIKAMGSRNPIESAQATEAFAQLLSPVVSKVIDQAATAGAIYQDLQYDADDNPSFPLDLYYNESDNYVTVFAQHMAGGLPTSTDTFANQDLKIGTYVFNSAVSLMKRYARRGRLDVVARAVARMIQEVLVKQERNAWAVVLKAIAEGATGSLDHVVENTGGTTFQLNMLNTLMTRMKRLNESFAQGSSTDAFSRGITNLFISPEVMEDIRSFSYNAVGGSTSGATVTDLPDGVRQDIYRSAGSKELFGITLSELLELGIGKKYNVLFDTFNGGAFDGTTDDLIVGIDASRGAFIRAVAVQDESTFNVMADDQFKAREGKIGFYGELEEGRVCIDARAAVAATLEA